MSAPYRLLAAVALAAAMVAVPAAPARAADPKLPRDGWVSWDVPAVDEAPAWCCLDWSDHVGRQKSCQLDGHANFGSRDHETTDTITVYARSTGGKVDRLRIFAASCPVEAKTPVQELTDVTPDDSARWLFAQTQSKPLTEEALAGLALHRGDFAHDSLVRVGTSAEASGTRSKAWFWLAMTGAKDAESPISAALRRDPDGGVREQAVFALSRLPGDRATKALIATAEDRSLSREQRKRAVFWLSQSESTAALAYLDKVLAASSAVPK